MRWNFSVPGPSFLRQINICVFFLFCIVPNFNILKTCSWHFQCKLGYFGVSIVLQTLTWAGGSLTCVCGPFACVCTRGDLGLQSHLSDFCRVCTEFDSGEISEQAQSLDVIVTHPFGDHTWSCSTSASDSESEYSCSVPLTPHGLYGCDTGSGNAALQLVSPLEGWCWN